MRTLHRDERRKNTNRIKKQLQQLMERYNQEGEDHRVNMIEFILTCCEHDDIFYVENIVAKLHVEANDDTVAIVDTVLDMMRRNISERKNEYTKFTTALQEIMKQHAPDYVLGIYDGSLRRSSIASALFQDTSEGYGIPTAHQVVVNNNNSFTSSKGHSYRDVHIVYYIPTIFPEEEFHALNPYGDDGSPDKLTYVRHDGEDFHKENRRNIRQRIRRVINGEVSPEDFDEGTDKPVDKSRWYC